MVDSFPPWEDEVVADARPSAQNQGVAQQNRRENAAGEHLDKVSQLLQDNANVVVCTDAAQDDEQTWIAHYNESNLKTLAESVGKDTSVEEAELKSIEKSVKDFVQQNLCGTRTFTQTRKRQFGNATNMTAESALSEESRQIAKEIRAEGHSI